MHGRLIRTAARLAFFLCGVISFFTAAPFLMLRGAELPVQSEWIIFVAALGLLGLFSTVFALLPRSLIAKVCNQDRDDPRLFLLPLRCLAAFATISYLVAVFAYLAPHRWNLNPQWMFALCPLYFVRLTFDPSRAMTFCLLAPMNAGAYGSLGVALGYAWLAFHKRSSP